MDVKPDTSDGVFTIRNDGKKAKIVVPILVVASIFNVAIFAFLAFYFRDSELTTAFIVIAVLFLIAGPVGTLFVAKEIKRWEITVDGDRIYHKSLFAEKTFSFQDIKRVTTEDGVTSFFSDRERLFTISTSNEGYERFMAPLDTQELEKAQSAEATAAKKHMWKFQLWLSIIAPALIFAAYASDRLLLPGAYTAMEILQAYLLYLTITIWGGSAVLMILFAGNIITIFSLLRVGGHLTRGRRYFLAAISILLYVVIFALIITDGNANLHLLSFVVVSAILCFVATRLAGGFISEGRKYTMLGVYGLLAIFTVVLTFNSGAVTMLRIRQDIAAIERRELVSSNLTFSHEELADETRFRMGSLRVRNLPDGDWLRVGPYGTLNALWGVNRAGVSTWFHFPPEHSSTAILDALPDEAFSQNEREWFRMHYTPNLHIVVEITLRE